MSKLTSTRRDFLKGFLATPAVVQFGHIMPVSAGPLPYMPGDLIGFDVGTWRATGWYAICEPLRRIEGRYLVFAERPYNPEKREVRIHARHCSLFHGLPGNRVNNPSMQDSLIRVPGQIGLSYREGLPAGRLALEDKK